jgi:hypothetical protein
VLAHLCDVCGLRAVYSVLFDPKLPVAETCLSHLGTGMENAPISIGAPATVVISLIPDV